MWEDVKDQIEYWRRALVGYCVGGAPIMSMMRKFVNDQWNHVAKPTLDGQDSGWFIFHFHSREDMDAILKGGPWTLGSRALILKQWSPEFRFDKDAMASVPIWVNFIILTSIIGRPLHLVR